MDAGGPITRYLGGKWKLDKIVTLSQTKTGSQIGYTQIINVDNDKVNDFEQVYRDSLLISTHIWSRNPWPEASASAMTVLVTYDDGLKRFFRIHQGLSTITLETSDYLPQIGSAQDTVKFFYSHTQ